MEATRITSNPRRGKLGTLNEDDDDDDDDDGDDDGDDYFKDYSLKVLKFLTETKCCLF